jgi:hypothetical protein
MNSNARGAAKLLGQILAFIDRARRDNQSLADAEIAFRFK